ncbi:phosphatidate cytidylyltransferase [Micromonospora echinofusca]|uniref:Phosphatidate cytidylyltransferase n=1 Tax=Micromonospora echinofusca TaxID=47858 RepID=A0ABS3VP49_MICEH|nr:phosphatidate cytidylyltransferase [Micromonospora echinofusca]MBO4206334.1 phosphatidate cytidylyltransferase [Micromonospora echinofusca]
MSHLDPYGSTEPRSWDRPTAPTGLPWPAERSAPPPPAERSAPLPPAERSAPLPPIPSPDPRNGYPYEPAGGPDNGYPYEPAAPDDGYPYEPAGGPDDVPPTDPLAEPTRPPRGRRRAGRRRAGRPVQPSVPAGTAPGADTPPAAGRQSRAGRNLPAAIGVGVTLAAVVLVPLFLFRPAFLAVVAVAVAVGSWEMARAVRRADANPPLVPLLAGAVLMVGLAWWAGPDALSLGLLVTVLAAMVWRLADGPAGYQRDLTATALIAVYVPFLGGFAALLAAPDDGHLRVLVTLAAVVLSDTGGYAAGVTFGRHPMAPTVSPKKSWEGFAGSVLAAALGGALLLWSCFDVAPWWGALFGLAVSGAAVLGDLGESMIKRDLGVKDMSNLLPGHGGLMDRLDSILFAAPTAYLLLTVLVPVV